MEGSGGQCAGKKRCEIMHGNPVSSAQVSNQCTSLVADVLFSASEWLYEHERNPRALDEKN